MKRCLLNTLSDLSLLFLLAGWFICIEDVYLGQVRTVGWAATYSNRNSNIGVAVVVDPTQDTTGKVFEPYRDTEIVVGNARAFGNGGLELLGLYLSPGIPLGPPLRGYVVFIPWWWWTSLLAGEQAYGVCGDGLGAGGHRLTCVLNAATTCEPARTAVPNAALPFPLRRQAVVGRRNLLML